MWMGLDGDKIAWVSEQKVETFDGVIVEAPIGAIPGMVWDGVKCVNSVENEKQWISTEIVFADIEINKHLDGDARAIATETKWRTYRCQLRDYVKGGQIVGERPQRPV